MWSLIAVYSLWYIQAMFTTLMLRVCWNCVFKCCLSSAGHTRSWGAYMNMGWDRRWLRWVNKWFQCFRTSSWAQYCWLPLQTRHIYGTEFQRTVSGLTGTMIKKVSEQEQCGARQVCGNPDDIWINCLPVPQYPGQWWCITGLSGYEVWDHVYSKRPELVSVHGRENIQIKIGTRNKRQKRVKDKV